MNWPSVKGFEHDHQTVGYAATALGAIAALGGKSAQVKEVADNCEIPPAYLAKIVHALARKGIVKTQRGVGGGVCLARAAREITLCDLCEALEGPILLRRRLLGASSCSDDNDCPAHSFWTGHGGRLFEFLRRMTVADLAAFETRRPWRSPAK